MWPFLRRIQQPELELLTHAYRFHYALPETTQEIANVLTRFLDLRYDKTYSGMVILCIGTDRSTGDCLGPLIGSKLRNRLPPEVEIYGTLDEPVHAVNLNDVLQKINREPKPFILAIDACLGRSESIGYISIKDGPLRPGTGVNKNLPAVGDMHIIGIVNVGGFMEYMVLQNTRLSLVMRMSEIISAALIKTISASFPRNYSSGDEPIKEYTNPDKSLR